MKSMPSLRLSNGAGQPVTPRLWKDVWYGWLLASLLFCAWLQSFNAADKPAMSPSPRRDTMVATRKRKGPRRTTAGGASYSRYSSELQDEASLETQQQKCREQAATEGETIAAEYEFVDRAISGTKLAREGLNQLLAAAEAGKFSTLYLYSLSRLGRESVISMPILKRLVCVYRIRIISVTEGIDSNREGWEMSAQIVSIQHERYVKELSANVLRGQEANLTKGFSNGDYCFGYTSVPVAGSEQTRRGRYARPRRTYAIDPQQAEWVRQIFTWFVQERRSLSWITRELNRLGAPKDHRATSKLWHHQYVSKLLRNQKYVGRWPWGQMQNVRDPSSGKVTQEERADDITQQWLREFAELRLIDDEIFNAAQQYLRENEERRARGYQPDGKFSSAQASTTNIQPSHLLSGLIVCGHCERTFHVGGSHGKYLFCPGYRAGNCTCQTQLNRQLAEGLILRQISHQILANPAWLELVFTRTLANWRELQRSLPDELRGRERALIEIQRKIDGLLNMIEDSTTRDPDVQHRLQQRRTERDQLKVQIAVLQANQHQCPQEPTLAWLTNQLQNLQQILESPTPAAALALRNLVGGKIIVKEIRPAGRKRYFLQGTLRVGGQGLLAALHLSTASDCIARIDDPAAIQITFVRPDSLAERAEQAHLLSEQEKLHCQIAQEMQCSRSMVTKLLKYWSKVKGLTRIDGRTRRTQLAQQHAIPPLYQQIAERVMELYGENLLLVEIAQQLQCDRSTITDAIRWWHASRGLEVPDGRARRKDLTRKARKRTIDASSSPPTDESEPRMSQSTPETGDDS